MKIVSKDGGINHFLEVDRSSFTEADKQPAPAIVTIKLTNEQVRKLLKKKEITIAQFKFIIE